MSHNLYIASGVLIAAAITWALRAAPFAVLAPLRSSQLLAFLARRMPVGVMLILAVYTLRDTPLAEASAVIPAAVALAVTIGLQWWRGSMTLSMLGGTGCYVLLVSVLA